MRIVVATQEDPFYLPPALDALCRARGRDIVGIVILPAFNEGLRDTAGRLWEFYGPVDFMRLGVRFAGAKLADRVNAILPLPSSVSPRVGSFVYPVGIAALIDAAHANGMRVVAWYLPGFKNLNRDLRRSLDAIRFTTVAGGHFDSFALDIESNAVRNVTLRNRRAQQLSSRIRGAVGKQYPLGAITPDQRSTSAFLPSLWPRFPYSHLRPYYDVFLPMAYSSFRGKGARFVYGYTAANIQYLRLMTRDPSLPVHVIGGLANKLRPSEAASVVRAARDQGALGASFYDVRLTGQEEWQALQLGFAP